MKIAVIDDERPARKMLIRRVKEVRPDCEITEAESGADALKMFNEVDLFDLIFVDMDLGDMEGTTLAATAKRLFPGAKIVFATAGSTTVSRKLGRMDMPMSRTIFPHSLRIMLRSSS